MENMTFDLPSEVLDEIQLNIQNIIESFDIPDANKMDVIKKINFMYAQTKYMSLTDALTHLYNRRHFEVCFDREFKRSKRYHNDLSIAVIDIDLFKKINDTYGHSCGDYILKELAYIMNNNFRQTDMIFRYGGEEFVVILTETNADNACIPIERLRKRIEETKFVYNGCSINVSISAGISSNIELDECMQMFDEADKALYQAKENGRNQVRSIL